ncbi:hypothetical protein AB205_0021650, partial [Aquarana catesbeiana]
EKRQTTVRGSQDPPQVTSLNLELPQAPAQDHAHPTILKKERWSDVLVVEGQAAEPFSTDSAQRLIRQKLVWNSQIDRMREQIDSMRNRLDSMQQEMKNMIDVLGRI